MPQQHHTSTIEAAWLRVLRSPQLRYALTTQVFTTRGSKREFVSQTVADVRIDRNRGVVLIAALESDASATGLPKKMSYLSVADGNYGRKGLSTGGAWSPANRRETDTLPTSLFTPDLTLLPSGFSNTGQQPLELLLGTVTSKREATAELPAAEEAMSVSLALLPGRQLHHISWVNTVNSGKLSLEFSGQLDVVAKGQRIDLGLPATFLVSTGIGSKPVPIPEQPLVTQGITPA